MEVLSATKIWDQGRHNAFTDLIRFGDQSCPGLLWHDGVLWVSYYASHEGKTSIYLANLKLEKE